MAVDELIDEHVSKSQIKKAVDALHKHATNFQKQKEESELLPGKEQHIWLVVAVKRMHAEKKLKPARIPVKHALMDPRVENVCLITKDPQREYKDLLEQHKINFISRVVGISKFKGKFKPFEARRLLMKENGLFLADERVVPLLPGLLGKIFFEAKKQPIPVNLTRTNLREELENAINSSYFHQNQGTCSSVKIARLSHSPSQVFDNLCTAIPVLISRIREGWDNIQSLHIKTSSSVSLPIWTCDLGVGDGARWKASKKETAQNALEEQEEEWGGIGGGSSELDESVTSIASSQPSQKRKPQSEVVAAEPKKTKKAKINGAEESHSENKDTTSGQAPVSQTHSVKSNKKASEKRSSNASKTAPSLSSGNKVVTTSDPTSTPSVSLKPALKPKPSATNSVPVSASDLPLKKKVRLITGASDKKSKVVHSRGLSKTKKGMLGGKKK